MTLIDFKKRKNKIIEDRFDKMLNSNVVHKKSPTTIKWMKRIRNIITDRYIDTGKESTIDDITKSGINRNIVRRYIREVNGWGVVRTQRRKSFKAKDKDGYRIIGIKVPHYAPTKTYLKLAIEKRKKMIHIGDVLKTLTIDDFLSHAKDGLYYELLEKVPGFDKLSMDRQGEIIEKIWQTFVVKK